MNHRQSALVKYLVDALLAQAKDLLNHRVIAVTRTDLPWRRHCGRKMKIVNFKLQRMHCPEHEEVTEINSIRFRYCDHSACDFIQRETSCYGDHFWHTV